MEITKKLFHRFTKQIHPATYAGLDTSEKLANSPSMAAISFHQCLVGLPSAPPPRWKSVGAGDGLAHACWEAMTLIKRRVWAAVESFSEPHDCVARTMKKTGSWDSEEEELKQKNTSLSDPWRFCHSSHQGSFLPWLFPYRVEGRHRLKDLGRDGGGGNGERMVSVGIPKVFSLSLNMSISPWQLGPAGVQGFTHTWKQNKTELIICILHTTQLVKLVQAENRRDEICFNAWHKMEIWIWFKKKVELQTMKSSSTLLNRTHRQDAL